MKAETLLRWISIGLVAGLVVVLVLLFAREHKRADRLDADRRTLCASREAEITAILAGNAIGDVRARIRRQLLDPIVSKMCLGREVTAINFMDADACWINTNDAERCYREPLEQLLVLYKQHRD